MINTILVADPLAYGGGIAIVIASLGTAIVNIMAVRSTGKKQTITNNLLTGTDEKPGGLVAVVEETHELVNSQKDEANAKIDKLEAELIATKSEIAALVKAINMNGNITIVEEEVETNDNC